MKKFLLATAAFAAALAAFGVTAQAADLGARPYYQQPPAYAAPLYNWTGFYIGGHLGGVFAGDNTFGGLALTDSSARFMGGVQAGYDWQLSSSWVIGVEGQYSWVGNHQLNAIFPNGLIYNNNQRGIASLTGRFGYTWGPGLIYVKGGYAYSDNNETLTFGVLPVAFALSDNHSNGWTLGAGAEYMFAPNWSAKVEYQYYDFGDSHFTSPAALVPFGTFHNDEHTVKAGINYRFNLGNWGAPVAARY
ncbi:porin family protein [Bradyrhizobium jicamae]|uniref:Porin family protein n=1 Tax=Bradyrhizobium jicamae TaxID=280332 RepID=A0ABS5FLK5_9BRAD|nr:outer membrane beta-barrel protein [Bradyrhizobium jicamae]MBR0797657.1 porin family protein [Bradyrhizobium jicamae]MBR0933197.1 porin family protein [Bradyrhizobium jicamae]